MNRPCIYPHCSPDPSRCLRSCTAQPQTNATRRLAIDAAVCITALLGLVLALALVTP